MPEPTRELRAEGHAAGPDQATSSEHIAESRPRLPPAGLFAEPVAPATGTPASIEPVSSVGHASHEFKIQLTERGHFSGEFVVTLEAGKTGVGVDGKALGDRVSGSIKTLESTMSVKLNDFAAKVETSMVSGELDVAVIDNLKCAVEVTGASGSLSADGPEFDLASLSIKIVGDIGGWLELPDGVTATVDGRLTYSIGPEMLAKLAPVVARKAEIAALAKDAELITSEMAEHAKSLEAAKSAHADLLAKGAGASAIEKAEREIAAQTRLLQKKSGFLKSTLGKLKVAKKQLGNAIGSIPGRAGKRIARLIGKEVAERIGRLLVKAVPILNVVSTIFDIVEVIQAIHEIATSDAGGSADGSDDQGSGAGGSDDTAGGGAESSQKAPEGAAAEMQQAPARARALLESLKRGKGVSLDADQLTTLGLMLQELTDEELAAVKNELAQGMTATSVEMVFRTLRDAIARVRNPSGMVSVKVAVDGAELSVRRDLSVAIADHEAGESSTSGPTTDPDPMTREEPRVTIETFDQPTGPITTPSQVSDVNDPMNVVYQPTPALLHQWFQFRGDALESTQASTMWDLSVSSGTFRVTTRTTTSFEGDVWNAHIEFDVQRPGQKTTYVHHYWVTRSGEQMVFEPYGLFDDI